MRCRGFGMLFRERRARPQKMTRSTTRKIEARHRNDLRRLALLPVLVGGDRPADIALIVERVQPPYIEIFVPAARRATLHRSGLVTPTTAIRGGTPRVIKVTIPAGGGDDGRR